MTTQLNQSFSDGRNFRPKTLEDFIGQGNLKKTLRPTLDSAHQRSATLEHVVFYGGLGLGKTTLAAIAAAEQNARFHCQAVPSRYSTRSRENFQDGGISSTVPELCARGPQVCFSYRIVSPRPPDV